MSVNQLTENECVKEIIYSNEHCPFLDSSHIPTRVRARSISSTEILTWEPTHEEKELIKLTWSDDFDFLFELGSDIYCYIFNEMPECKKLFPDVYVHGENYKDTHEFKEQALKIVQTLSYAVKDIYHMNDLAAYLHKIGKRHVDFADRGFKPEMWDLFLDAMEVCLTKKINSIDKLGKKEKAEAVQVWKRLAFYIVAHMRLGFFSEHRATTIWCFNRI